MIEYRIWRWGIDKEPCPIRDGVPHLFCTNPDSHKKPKFTTREKREMR